MGGKKKTKAGANKTTAESVKEQGNAAYMAGNYEKAIEYYTQAIEMSGDKPNASFYGNRANVYLESGLNEKCIDDC